MRIQKLTFFRFAVFGIWVFTLLIIVGCFVIKMIVAEMEFTDVRDGLTNIASLVLPQIAVMTGFFFGATKPKQREKLDCLPTIANLAICLSLIYHFVFWACLVLGVGFGTFGKTLGPNVDAIVLIVGLFSLLGLSPVAYLFARQEAG
jgi:hypothetical protein